MEKFEKKAAVDFDDLLPHIGGFGRFQMLLLIPVIFANYTFPAVYFAQVI